MIGNTNNVVGETIQLILSPAMFQSAYRPIVFRIQSTVANHPEQKIKAELYARNSTTGAFTHVCTKYENLYPGQQYYQFNFAQNLRAFLSFDRQGNPSFSCVTPTPYSIVEYQVKFTQVYYDTDGFMQEYYSVYSDILKAIQGVRQHADVQTFVDYIIWGGAMGDNTTRTSFSVDFNTSFGH